MKAPQCGERLPAAGGVLGGEESVPIKTAAERGHGKSCLFSQNSVQSSFGELSRKFCWNLDDDVKHKVR